MNKGDAFHKIQKALSEIRQELSADSKNLREVKAEKPDYAIEGYARLLQLARQTFLKIQRVLVFHHRLETICMIL